MYILVFTVYITMCVCISDALDNRNLLYVINGSPYSLPELWNVPGVFFTSKYAKDETVDKLTYWIPELIELTIKDGNFGTLSYIKFEVQDTSSFESLLQHGNILSSYLFPNLGQFIVEIRENNSQLLLANPNDRNMVYLAHGRFYPNSQSLTTCFSPSGSLFSLNRALQTMSNNYTQFYDQTFDGIFELTISLSALGNRFVNGIEVSGFSSTSTTFTLKYATWGSWCDTKNYNSPPNLTFNTDGIYRELPVFMAGCIYIVFSDYLYSARVKLTKPAEDYIFGDALQIWGKFDPEPKVVTSTQSIIDSKTTMKTTEQSTTNNQSTTEAKEQSTTNIKSTVEEITNEFVRNSTLTTIIPEALTETTQQLTTTETTTESGITSTVALGYCECQCDLPQYSNISIDEIIKTLKQITDILTVNKSELSSTIRQKTCADDDRPSARGVGYIGCGVLTTVLVLILFVDLHTIFTYLRGKS